MHRGGMAVGTEKRFSMIGLIYAADDAILDSRSFPRDDGRSDRVFRDNVARTADSYLPESGGGRRG